AARRGACELPAQLHHQADEAGVGNEQVGAEPDDSNRQAAVLCEPQRLLQLVDRLRARERGGGPARPEGGETREQHVLLDVHASRSSNSGAARSTSPAPIVRTRSPARARAATKRAPSS